MLYDDQTVTFGELKKWFFKEMDKVKKEVRALKKELETAKKLKHPKAATPVSEISSDDREEQSVDNNGHSYYKYESDDIYENRDQHLQYVTSRSKHRLSRRNAENNINIGRNVGIDMQNRFSALRFESNQPAGFDNAETDDDEGDMNTMPTVTTRNPTKSGKSKIKPVRPGNKSYAQSLNGEGKKTLVFTTSISKNIQKNEFNRHNKNGDAYFRRFPGAKARHMKNYISTHLEEERPDTIIIHAGGNDLPTSRENPLPVLDIANDLIEAAQTCKLSGATQIMVSSVLPRKAKYMNIRCGELNGILKNLCYLYDFTFIDHEGYITTKHLSKDGVHLSDEGTRQLAKDYLHYLNMEK